MIQKTKKWVFLSVGMMAFGYSNAQIQITPQDFQVTDNTAKIERALFSDEIKTKQETFEFVDGYVVAQQEKTFGVDSSFSKSIYQYHDSKNEYTITKTTYTEVDSIVTTEDYKVLNFSTLKFTFPSENLEIVKNTEEKIVVKLNNEVVHKYIIKVIEESFIECRNMEFRNGAVYKQKIDIYDNYGTVVRTLVKSKEKVFVDHTTSYYTDGLLMCKYPNIEDDLDYNNINYYYEKDINENWIKKIKFESDPVASDIQIKEYILRKLTYNSEDSTGVLEYDKVFESAAFEKQRKKLEEGN